MVFVRLFGGGEGWILVLCLGVVGCLGLWVYEFVEFLFGLLCGLLFLEDVYLIGCENCLGLGDYGVGDGDVIVGWIGKGVVEDYVLLVVGCVGVV